MKNPGATNFIDEALFNLDFIDSDCSAGECSLADLSRTIALVGLDACEQLARIATALEWIGEG